jgi:hypothetical protein
VRPPASARAVTRLLAAALLTAPAAAACSAPAPVQTFTAMPPPQASLVTVLGPVTGTGTRTLTITARHTLSYTLSCLGHHIVWLRTTPSIAGFAVHCGDGGGFGGESATTPGRDAGGRFSLRITAPSGTTWELRVDGSTRCPGNPTASSPRTAAATRKPAAARPRQPTPTLN